MKRAKKTASSKDPIEIKAGNVIVKIYRSETHGRPLFTVTYRDTNNQRIKKSFAELRKAKVEAYAAAAKIQSGQIDVLDLTSGDRIAYQHAVRVLKPTGQPVDLVATEYAEAFRLLKGVGSLPEAARFFAKHHSVSLPKRTVLKVYEEFLAAKKADRASQRYLQDIRSRLGRFAAHFGDEIREVTTRQIDEWLAGLKSGPVARNSMRALIVTLFNYARQRGYLPKNQPTEADEIAESKEPPTKIGIFTPIEMGKLLEAAADKIVPYLAIGGFAGLRHAELMRLDWGEVKLDQGFVEITASNAKTAQRRIVPIQQNLARWLQPHAKTTGLIFSGDGSRFLNKVTQVARDCEIKWPHNGLRHSFASYRLAQCKSAAEVALEMGNSPRIIFQHYRELVAPIDAAKWWSVTPVQS